MVNVKTVEEKILIEYKKVKVNKTIFFVSITIMILFFCLFAITLGPLDITLADSYRVILHKIFPRIVDGTDECIERTIWLVRFPRILTGLLVGFSLAIAGATMQPVLNNQMASPFTLGISSGAGFGAALAIIMNKSIGSGSYQIVANAFLFSLMTSLVILLISKTKGAGPGTMVLVGIALSHLFTAATTVLQYFAEAWEVSEVVFWMVGSLSKGTWESLRYMFPVVVILVPYLILKAGDLNSISTGDDSAKSLGVNVERVRVSLLIVASLVTAVTICFTGAIGFVGLVAPHITRMIGGGDNRFVIPASGFVGALLVTVSDVIAMNIMAPVIIPIGVMTSLMGVPLFIYLIIREKKGGI